MTRVATPASEASLCDFAMTTTAATLEERCRQLRNVQPESAHEANRVHANRSLSIWRNATRGTMTITVELPIEQGELVSQALDKAAEQHVADGPDLASENHIKHCADGGETDVDNLVSLCSRHHRLVHEGGYTIATDHAGRLYFRRRDGRAIPAHGYRPEDMLDDDVGDSAEAYSDTRTPRRRDAIPMSALPPRGATTSMGKRYGRCRRCIASTIAERR